MEFGFEKCTKEKEEQQMELNYPTRKSEGNNDNMYLYTVEVGIIKK